MAMHADINTVVREGNRLLNISALSQVGPGYGIGFTTSLKYLSWELETGFVYAAKQYDPNIIEQYGGIVNFGDIRQKHFKRVHLQTLRIPFNLRFNYARTGKGKWHFYTQTGASLNVIVRAEYDIADTGSSGRWTGGNSASSKLSGITFNKGLLSGDGFKENRYFSVNVGTGVERYINSRWSVFLQPEFHYYLSSSKIGPTNDRIDAVSVSVGARVSME